MLPQLGVERLLEKAGQDRGRGYAAAAVVAAKTFRSEVARCTTGATPSSLCREVILHRQAAGKETFQEATFEQSYQQVPEQDFWAMADRMPGSRLKVGISQIECIQVLYSLNCADVGRLVLDIGEMEEDSHIF